MFFSPSGRRHALRFSLVPLLAITALLPAFSGIAQADPEGSFPNCPLLVEGDSGSCVGQLQAALNTVDSEYNLTIDDVFGADTRIAVLDFQGRNELDADGNVGPSTAQALLAQAEAALSTTDSSTISPSRSQPRTQIPGSGSADTLGGSPLDCAWEFAKDEVPVEVVRDFAARRMGVEEFTHKLSKRLLPIEIAKVVGCVFLAQD